MRTSRRRRRSDATGYTEGTIATTIKELVAANYLVSTRRAPEGSARALAHYAVVKPSVEELRAAVDAHIALIRGSNARGKEPSARWADVKTVVHSRKADVNPVVHLSQPDVNTVVHVNGPDVNPVIHVNGAVAGATPKADVNPVVPTVTSLVLNLEQTPVSNLDSGRAKRSRRDDRGSRLPDAWFLPLAWGEWALAEFDVSADAVRDEADRFKDYWHTRTGRDGVMLRWEAVWRNWCRSEIRNWPKRKKPISSNHAPTLVGDASTRASPQRGRVNGEAAIRLELEKYLGDDHA